MSRLYEPRFVWLLVKHNGFYCEGERRCVCARACAVVLLLDLEQLWNAAGSLVTPLEEFMRPLWMNISPRRRLTHRSDMQHAALRVCTPPHALSVCIRAPRPGLAVYLGMWNLGVCVCALGWYGVLKAESRYWYQLQINFWLLWYQKQHKNVVFHLPEFKISFLKNMQAVMWHTPLKPTLINWKAVYKPELLKVQLYVHLKSVILAYLWQKIKLNCRCFYFCLPCVCESVCALCMWMFSPGTSVTHEYKTIKPCASDVAALGLNNKPSQIFDFERFVGVSIVMLRFNDQNMQIETSAEEK